MKPWIIAALTLLVATAASADSRTLQQPRSTGPAPVTGNEPIRAEMKRPRLFVNGFAYTPSPAQAGQGLNLDIKVRNGGEADASESTAKLWLDCRNLNPAGPNCPFGKHSYLLPAIPVGQTRSVILATQPWQGGSYRISGWVTLAPYHKPARGRPWTTSLEVQGSPTKLPQGDKMPGIQGGLSPTAD